MTPTESLRQKIAELRKVCDGATESPFEVSKICDSIRVQTKGRRSKKNNNGRFTIAEFHGPDASGNADFVIQSRTALPSALDALEKCLGELEKIKQTQPTSMTKDDLTIALTIAKNIAFSALDEAAKIMGVKGN